jgi:DNA primase catalytic core
MVMDSPKPDIIQTLQNEGVELKHRGRSYIGLCPFHQEKHPSFTVNPEKQIFHCFGCGEHGDVISLVQKLHQLTFRQALAYLSIAKGASIEINSREKRKRQLVKSFRQWERACYDELARTRRAYTAILRDLGTIEAVERRAWIYHELPVLEYHMDLIKQGDDEARYRLYQEVSNARI